MSGTTRHGLSSNRDSDHISPVLRSSRRSTALSLTQSWGMLTSGVRRSSTTGPVHGRRMAHLGADIVARSWAKCMVAWERIAHSGSDGLPGSKAWRCRLARERIASFLSKVWGEDGGCSWARRYLCSLGADLGLGLDVIYDIWSLCLWGNSC